MSKCTIRNQSMVAILLATYNGEKFLREQLDSIVNQDFTNWTLFIHDDGSNDGTLIIINEYCKQYKNIFLIDDELSHRGAAESFIFLLKLVDSSYYMFCDQDDVWMSDKISKSIECFKNVEASRAEQPLLVVSDLIIVDENLNIIRYSMWDKRMKSLIYDSTNLILQSLYTGCTMCFNRIARNKCLLLKNPFNLLHDELISWAVFSNQGQIIVLETPLMYYRQHTFNVVGADLIDAKWENRVHNIQRIMKRWVLHYRIAHYYINKSFGGYLFKYLKSRISNYI